MNFHFFHKWKTVFNGGRFVRQKCSICNKERQIETNAKYIRFPKPSKEDLERLDKILENWER